MLREQAEGVRVILHCFSMTNHIEECLAHHDWWLSFAGNLTYRTAEPLRAAAALAPPERLLVETDAPYLTPHPLRGKPNQPANVVHTACAIAAQRGVSYEELEGQIERTAAALFGW